MERLALTLMQTMILVICCCMTANAENNHIGSDGNKAQATLLKKIQSRSPIDDSTRILAESLVIDARESKNVYCEAEANYILGKHHFLLAHREEGKFHFKQAMECFHLLKMYEREGFAMERLGMSYLQEGVLDSALTCFLDVIDLYHDRQLAVHLWSPLLNISSVYRVEGNIPEAFRYGRLAVSEIREDHDRATKSLILNRMMTLARDFDSIGVYAEFSDRFYRLYSPLEIDSDLIQHVGLYDQIADPEERISAIRESIRMLGQWPATLELASSYHQLGEVYAGTGRMPAALDAWNEGLRICNNNPAFTHLKPVLLQSLSRGYQQMHMSAEALEVFKELVALKDSLSNVYSRAKIDELQIQYETREKDNQILSQSLSLAKRTQQRNLVLIVMATLLIGGLYIVYAQRRYLHAQKTIAAQHQTLHENEIRELKKEHALQTLQTLIRTQEDERTRIAKDLHDSIGASLATLRMKVRDIGGTNVALENTLSLLDATSAEVRRISHNMMPQALIKMGLPAALEDLATSIQQSQELQVSFQNIDYTEPLSQDKEITLYRIAQELCTNTMKHSDATHLIIQLSRHNGSAMLVVEDDGCGFESEEMNGTGIGLQNIRSRVDYLGGDMELISKSGEGTSVSIQIPAQ